MNKRPVEAYVAGWIFLFAAAAGGVMAWAKFQSNTDLATIEESFRAIDMNSTLFLWHGVARISFGAAVIVSMYFVRRALILVDCRAFNVSSVLSICAGGAMILSGACAVALPGAIVSNEAFGVMEPESLHTGRWILGSFAYAVLGLGIASLGRVQWNLPGLMKPYAVFGVVLGAAMMFVWWDADTALHALTATGLLVWFIITATILMTGDYMPPTLDADPS